MLDGTLLVALVDSEAGRNAAEQAVQLAASSRSKLVGISVVPAMDGDVNTLHFPNAREAMSAPHRAILDAARDMAARRGVAFTPLLAQGQIHEHIVDAAEAENVSCIILGDSRRGAIERAILGPTASRVVGYTPRDVLVIPQQATIDFQRVILAMDGSLNSRNAATCARDLAEAYGSQVTVLIAVNPLPEYHLWDNVVEDMLARARRVVDDVVAEGEQRGLKLEPRVVLGDPAGEIVKAAEELRAGCIVMGSHGRTGLRRLLMGSVAETVLVEAPCPVLIVH